jgi:hypothetical protein
MSERPEQISVDGLRSPDGAIEYWGQATKQPNGLYLCFANVAGMLCVVEVRITMEPRDA